MKRAVLSGLLLWSCFAVAADFPEIEGWERQGEPEAYDAGDLWEYINGAADQFLAYGFRLLQACNLAAGDVHVSVHVYDMGVPLNAFGMYGVEKSEGTPDLPIGAGSVLYAPYQALLLKDRYYVKIESPTGQLADSVGTQLLEAIARALPGRDDPPEELRRLPAADMVAGSQRYTKEGYLGLSDLRNCVHAAYQDAAGESYNRFAMIPEEGKSARDLWRELAAKWQAVEPSDLPVLSKKIPYKGPVWLVLTEAGIQGIFGVADEGQLSRFLSESTE